MFILQVATFMTVYPMVGAEWAFEPASFQASTRWTIMTFVVIFVTSAIAGLICALIARGGKAPLVLAAVVLIVGIGLAATVLVARSGEQIEVRRGDVPSMEAMSKARQHSWVIFTGPIVGALGILVGGKLKRQS
jgi:hypothetical protein